MDKSPRHSEALTTLLPPDVDQELRALWPTLPARERALWLRILGALLPPDAHVLEQLEHQDNGRQQEQRDRNRGAVHLLESWMAEDAAMSPAAQQAALVEWEHLQRLLDEEYVADTPLAP